MLDVQYLRQNADAVRDMLERRSLELSLTRFEQLDERRRELLGKLEKLQQFRNENSKRIGALMKAGDREAAAGVKEEVREVNERIKRLDDEVDDTQSKLDEFLAGIPNVLHDSVPTGADEADNREERRWGDPPAFDFEPQAHWDLGPALGILDFERAAKVTGARFSVSFGAGAQLERALIQFMLDVHTTEHGYTEVLPPFMVNAKALFGTGQLPKFGADLFKVDPEGYYLVPTAEVPVTNLHAGEILDADALPIAYAAYTPCFRSEAGSYGKDVRGLIRQHQFNKVELVRFCPPEDSYDELEKLTGHAESILQRLELPYRVVTLCSGDVSFSSAKTYDLEVWLPGQQAYREISSCSNFESFQARRAKIRYRPEPKAKTRMVHTLNGSGLAVGRTVVAILENHQRADGSVAIPDVLRPYMGGRETIERR